MTTCDSQIRFLVAYATDRHTHTPKPKIYCSIHAPSISSCSVGQESAREEAVLFFFFFSRVKAKLQLRVGKDSAVTSESVHSNWRLNSPSPPVRSRSFRIPHKSPLRHLRLWASPALSGAWEWARCPGSPRYGHLKRNRGTRVMPNGV